MRRHHPSRYFLALRHRPLRTILTLALLVGLVLCHRQILRLCKFGYEVSFCNIRLGLCTADQDLCLIRQDGIRLAASVYRPGMEGLRPAVLLLHGSTEMGRQLALYRLLGRRLAQRGYVVLSPDFAGFGDSQDPFEADDPAAVDADRDVCTALDWLRSREDVDQRRIFLLAHSGGSMFAMNAARRKTGLQALAVIGPPRNVIQRLSGRDQVEYFFQRTRDQWRHLHQRDFPAWYTLEHWYAEVMAAGAATTLLGDITRHLPFFSGPDHPPLLLIDGSREWEADLHYLDIYAQVMSEPKGHLRLVNGDHFANTFNWFGLVLYDAKVMAQLLDGIDGWFVQAANTKPTNGDDQISMQ